MISRAKNNTIERFEREVGRPMTEWEQSIFQSGYVAGHEDKADQMQPEYIQLSVGPTPPRPYKMIKTPVTYGV